MGADAAPGPQSGQREEGAREAGAEDPGGNKPGPPQSAGGGQCGEIQAGGMALHSFWLLPVFSKINEFGLSYEQLEVL